MLAALMWGFLSSKWGVFPDGYVPLTDDPVQWLWHLLLPWIAAALPFVGAYTQVVRSSLLRAADEDWVRTARAKGLSERRVLTRHVLRNGLIPPMTIQRDRRRDHRRPGSARPPWRPARVKRSATGGRTETSPGQI